MPIHPRNLETFDIIDAAFFSGDTFYVEENLKIAKEFIERWQYRIKEIEDQNNLEKQEITS
jgi:hypothetical protein